MRSDLGLPARLVLVAPTSLEMPASVVPVASSCVKANAQPAPVPVAGSLETVVGIFFCVCVCLWLGPNYPHGGKLIESHPSETDVDFSLQKGSCWALL